MKERFEDLKTVTEIPTNICLHEIYRVDFMTTIADEQLFFFAERAVGKVLVLTDKTFSLSRVHSILVLINSTGGGNGIGRQTCLRFAKHGAKVVIGDIDAVAAKETVAQIKGAGGEAAFVRCNVCSWDDQLALFEFAIKTFGSVDIVVANAGAPETGQFDVPKFKNGNILPPNLKTIEVNVKGTLYTSQLALYYLKTNREPGSLKCLVLMASMTSLIGISNSSVYCSSKHAIFGMMRSLTSTFEKEDIRIASIHPWSANTDFIPFHHKLFLAGIPMVPVERIASSVFYAATDPNKDTSGSAWLLADDGPLFLVRKEQFKFGLYELIDDRVNKRTEGVDGLVFYARVMRTLGAPLAFVIFMFVVVKQALSGYLW